MSDVDGRHNNFWYSRTDSDRVLVFVHGIFSDSRTCWLHRDRLTEKDMLPIAVLTSRLAADERTLP
jgi:hypothetical protein